MQDVVGQVRTLRLALEAGLAISIPETSAIMDWAIEHAAYVLSP